MGNINIGNINTNIGDINTNAVNIIGNNVGDICASVPVVWVSEANVC